MASVEVGVYSVVEAQCKSVKKWSKKEDDVLLKSAEANRGTPDFKALREQLPHRSSKQARERWDNTVNPDISHGLWTTSEQLHLLQCLSKPEFYEGDMLSVKTLALEFPLRSRNSIKKKARVLLGEKVSKRCQRVSMGSAKDWTADERKLLLVLHSVLKKDYEEIAVNLKTGRSCAQVERELVECCDCGDCTLEATEIVQAGHGFKKGWNMRKAMSIYQEMLSSGMEGSDNGGGIVGAGKWLSGKASVGVKGIGSILGKRKSRVTVDIVHEAPFASKIVTDFISVLSKTAKLGPNLARKLVKHTISNRLGADILATLSTQTFLRGMRMLSPAMMYMFSSPTLIKDMTEKDPRFAKEFLLPCKKDRCFNKKKKIGTTVRRMSTFQLLYVCSYHEEFFLYDPHKMGPLETVYSKLQIYHLGTIAIPVLQEKGEVWVRCLELKADGTVVVIKQHHKILKGGVCICRYQDITDRYKHLLDLPPPLH